VQVRKTDVERLIAEAAGNQAPAASEAQEADTKSHATAPNAQEAGPLVQAAAPDAQEADTKAQAEAPDAREAGPLAQAVASELHRLSPDGRPMGVSIKELGERVRESAGKKLGAFSQRTLTRAIGLAWPPRQTTPNHAKPRQTSC
jgi:hypothetical protein